MEAGEDYVMKSFITCTLPPSTFRVIKSRRMRWASHKARMGERTMLSIYWSEKLNGRDHAEDLDIDGRMLE
jgi:hypothetical protein